MHRKSKHLFEMEISVRVCVCVRVRVRVFVTNEDINLYNDTGMT